MVAAAGPALIVAAVLVVLRGFGFGGRLSSQHPDILAFWLPTYCFLGRSLVAGHVPAWNPFVMGGVPFAADPQSGWMYLPAMALFTALPCDLAMRWMIVLQPLLGGLGLYAFLRSEGLSRPAATVGGLSLSLGLSGSRLGLFLPFPSAFAWTAVALAASSKLFKAESSSGRLLWAAATALAWGQIAAAHFAHGAVIGTLALVTFWAAKAWQNVRSDRWTGRTVIGLFSLLAGSMLLLNLAFLLPRLVYLPDTSFGPGYTKLTPLQALEAPAWPLDLSTAPGGYLGLMTLLLSGAAFWDRRRRPLAVAFGAFGLASYLLGLEPVASRIASLAGRVPLLDFYVHFPGRFSLGLLIALPVLGAMGLEAWREAGPVRSRRIAMLGPAAVVWVALPLAFGLHTGQVVFLAVAAAVAGAVLAGLARWPALAVTVPVVLALDLTVSGLAGQSAWGAALYRQSKADPLGPTVWFGPLVAPNIDASAYLRPDPIVRALRSAGDVRYLSLAPEIAGKRGYLVNQRPKNWALEANQRAMLFAIQDVQGYNPVQLGRYWRFVREVTVRRIDYNAAIFDPPTPGSMDLLQVGFIVGRIGPAPEAGAREVARVGEWVLWRRATTPLLASVFSSWEVAGSPDEALRRVTAQGFNPSRYLVVEADNAGALPNPPSETGLAAGTADVTDRGAQFVQIEVSAERPSVVAVRIPFERNWHARVDGQTAAVIPANYLVQGVLVPAGDHVVELTYDDPWIGYGLAGSAAAILAVVIGLTVIRLRRKPAGPAPTASAV